MTYRHNFCQIQEKWGQIKHLGEHCKLVSSLSGDRNAIPAADTFLRAIAECFARLSHRLGVRPSVCHTRDLYQNNAS